MSIRELTWQIKQVVLEAQNLTSLRIFNMKTYEISDLDNIKNTRISAESVLISLIPPGC